MLMHKSQGKLTPGFSCLKTKDDADAQEPPTHAICVGGCLPTTEIFPPSLQQYSIGMKVQSAFALSLWKSCLISMMLLRFGMDAAGERGENFSWHSDPKHRSRQQLVLFVTNWPASVAAHLFERAVASSILFRFSSFFLLAALRIGNGFAEPRM